RYAPSWPVTPVIRAFFIVLSVPNAECRWYPSPATGVAMSAGACIARDHDRRRHTGPCNGARCALLQAAEQAARGRIPARVAVRAAHGLCEAGRELLAELDAPLVERVDAPDHAFDEHLVLVQGDQLPEDVRREPAEQDRVARAIAGMHFVRRERADLLLRGARRAQVRGG